MMDSLGKKKELADQFIPYEIEGFYKKILEQFFENNMITSFLLWKKIWKHFRIFIKTLRYNLVLMLRHSVHSGNALLYFYANSVLLLTEYCIYKLFYWHLKFIFLHIFIKLQKLILLHKIKQSKSYKNNVLCFFSSHKHIWKTIIWLCSK